MRARSGVAEALFPLLETLDGWRRRAAALGLWGVVVATAVYATLILSGVGTSGRVSVAESLYYVVGFAAATLCVVRGLLVRHGRLPWLVLGAGTTIWIVADICSWLVYHDAAPVPSPLDACYLAFYPTCYAAIVMLARNDVRGMLSSLPSTA